MCTACLCDCRPTDLSDLKQLHPSVGVGLEAVLSYEGDDFKDAFGLTFEVEYINIYIYIIL